MLSLILFIEISPDIVDFMYKTILPQLEQTLASCKGSDETQHNENQESYLLSDIFQDIGDDDDSSEVNTWFE